MFVYSNLKPDATDSELERERIIAAKFKVASVCVKPCHLKYAAELLEILWLNSNY